MTSQPTAKDAAETDPTTGEKDLSIGDEPEAMSQTIRVLERLAQTLGVPVDVFFEGAPRSESDAATAQDVVELTRAFRAIGDPVMRRYCLDVIKAAGAQEPRA